MRNFGLTNLGSGSSGNATVIHTPDGAILVDAGFCAKELERRLDSCGLEPSDIRAVLITHEHGDHTKGCRVFCDKYDLPVYVTEITGRALLSANRIGKRQILFTPGTAFDVCGTTVEPFTVPHDARDTVAFTFRRHDAKIAVATDLGFLSMLVKAKLSGCDAVLMESNHDKQMLSKSGRPISLIRRILSRHGHLSNEDAIGAFGEILSERTRYLILGHLSGDCNDPALVEHLATSKLNELRRNDIFLRIAAQETPGETCWID